MDLVLNIYKAENKAEVEKKYAVDSYELMLGTVEDIMEIIDIDKMTSNIEIAKVIVKCYKQLTPLLKDIFPGVTDEELKRVKVKELVPLFMNVCNTIIEDLGLLQQGK